MLPPRAFIASLVLVVALVACAPAGVGAPPASLQQAAIGPKRIVAAIMSEPVGFNGILPFNRGPGNDAMEEMLHAGLANVDNQTRLQAVLAEAVPSIENGLWKILPDGRMETTWTLKQGVRWHDGAPFTTDDLAFTIAVARDKSLAVRGHIGFDFIEDVRVVDPRTVTVLWNRPLVEADTLFTRTFSPPIPKHLLDRPYREDKLGFTDLPYWTEEFVGLGAYKLRELVRGSHLVAQRHDSYILGRPRIDEIEVRFLRDQSALSAAILAGAVEVTLGRNLTLDPATQVRDQWRDGRMEIAVKSWIVVYPQFLSPTPAVVGDVQFRRALLHAINRQELAESLQAGLVPVAHSLVSPTTPVYREIEPSIVRYEYDLRKAAQTIESLGYARGAGGVYQDAGAQPLSVEIRVLGGDDLPEKATFSVADYWRRLGLAAEPLVVPPQRERDQEYRATFPAFSLHRQPNEPSNLGDYRIAETPTPENRFQGRNRARYANHEFEALIQRFATTIPRGERTEVLARTIHHMTDQVIALGLIYNTEPTLIGNRLVNVMARTGEEGSTHTWNVHLWDVKQ